MEWAVWKDNERDILGCHVEDIGVVAGKETREELKKCLESQGLIVNDLRELDVYIGIRIDRNRPKRQVYSS